MRLKSCIVFILTLSLLLCACVSSTSESTDFTTQPTIAEPTISTIPTTVVTPPPETTAMPTIEATNPIHSPLYLPQYTTAQITEYFNEVVLDMEYSDGTGDVTLVQKWTCPIYYYILGTPTEEDNAVLSKLFEQLNQLPGFPGIYTAADASSANLTIHFLDYSAFEESFSEVINSEYAFGATQFWYYTATNELYTARIGYRTDIDQQTRNSILLEEIINTLGISDTTTRTDSIVYQYSDENTSLSDIDWIILKLLYDPAILCGMDADACPNAIAELYY
ncbi:MAG: DUF2927 domain-containing protein [Oscillospiraceae bacterium]|nr:DUF2927 domain-containing protein [Oscillospiraceae bacterium]